MAKLNPNAQQVSVPQIPQPQQQRQDVPAGKVTAVSQPFSIESPASLKSAKTSAASKKAKADKTTRLSGEAWFKENCNFPLTVSDIVQIQRFPSSPSRSEGFKCPPCGIPGTRGIVIKAKPGKGEDITIFKLDPETKQMASDGKIKGFIVGATCLKKYGHIDINKWADQMAMQEKQSSPQQMVQPGTTQNPESNSVPAEKVPVKELAQEAAKEPE